MMSLLVCFILGIAAGYGVATFLLANDVRMKLDDVCDLIRQANELLSPVSKNARSVFDDDDDDDESWHTGESKFNC